MYLLDTNAWIEVFRGTSESLSKMLGGHSRDDIFLCSIVVAELEYGVLRSPRGYRPHNQMKLDAARQYYVSIVFDDDAACEAAEIRATLAATGRMIGGNDLLIAGIARSRGLTLVTHNISEFSRVPDLVVEDWQST